MLEEPPSVRAPTPRRGLLAPRSHPAWRWDLLVAWRALERGERVALAALALLLTAAAGVRVWLLLDYGQAFLGFGDSHEYLSAASLGVFSDPQKPAGYPIFLALAHALDARLSLTILVQHGLGLATGVLLYATVRRAGAPGWSGLFPAAVAFFGGTGLLLEHSLLADPLFAFLQAWGLYAAVCALGGPGLRWALIAGLLMGVAFWVKTVGLSGALLVPCVLLLTGAGARRRRLSSAAAAAVSALVLILGYAVVQAQVTGYWGYERQGAWNLYGRVASFADCAHLAAPPGTSFLCPREPTARRLSESYYQYARAAPAVQRFGGPAHASADANAELQAFSIAAITQQPIAYAGAILHSLSLYVTPQVGEGYTPNSIREALLDRKGTRSIERTVAAYYPGGHGYARTAGGGPLLSYERHSRIEGALLVCLLLLALAGTLLLRGRQRAAALLLTLSAICSVILAAAGNSYDARYGYPAFGPLAAGAALGAWGISVRVRGARRARSGGRE